MTLIKQDSRIKHHAWTGMDEIATVPTAEDFTDELTPWEVTDLADREFGLNKTDNRVYGRNEEEIYEVPTSKNIRWIYDLKDAQDSTFHAPYDLKIHGIEDIFNAPTTTITVGGGAYTLRTQILKGTEITVSVTIASEIVLHIEELLETEIS